MNETVNEVFTVDANGFLEQNYSKQSLTISSEMNVNR